MAANHESKILYGLIENGPMDWDRLEAHLAGEKLILSSWTIDRMIKEGSLIERADSTFWPTQKGAQYAAGLSFVPGGTEKLLAMWTARNNKD